MRFEGLDWLDYKKQEELRQALQTIDVLAGIGKAISLQREQQELLERTFRSLECESGAVRSPEGFCFAITGREFNISQYLSKSGYEDSGWSYTSTKVYKKDQVYIANEIRNDRSTSLSTPGVAFAYGAFNDQVRYTYERTRIALDSLEGISLIPEAKLPKNLVNPLPDYAKLDDESVIF